MTTNYDLFFGSYKGIKLNSNDYVVMNVVSAENTEHVSYRPAIITRYTYEKPNGLETEALYVIKNVGSGKW